jgi:hypothetical protein
MRPKKYCVKVGEFVGGIAYGEHEMKPERFENYKPSEYPTKCFSVYRDARNYAGKMRKALKAEDVKQLVILEPVENGNGNGNGSGKE